MLILTRKIGDSVVIRHPTGDILVTYLSSQGPTGTEIRIGFDAPKEVNIVRSEILDRYPDDKLKEKTRNG
jgi:carbon storage regulator CsrA